MARYARRFAGLAFVDLKVLGVFEDQRASANDVALSNCDAGTDRRVEADKSVIPTVTDSPKIGLTIQQWSPMRA